MNPGIEDILKEISNITLELPEENRIKLGGELMKLAEAILETTEYERKVLDKGQIDE